MKNILRFIGYGGLRFEFGTHFRHSQITLPICSFMLMLLFCFLLINGCRKDGSSSDKQILQGNQAFHAGAVATYQSYQCRRAISFAGFGLASPSGSKIRRIVANSILKSYGTSEFLNYGSDALKRTSLLTGALTFVPYLNLYTDGGSFNGNIATVRYYSDAAGANSKGSITITLPANITNPLDPTSYASYPANIAIAINITGGNLPCTGNLVISFTDATGANTMTGTNTLTKDNVVFNLNLTLDNQMNASGSITVKESGATLLIDNVEGNLATPPLTCRVNVSPYGWTGTGTLNLMTGSMTANVNMGTGVSTAASDSLYNLNINYADGTHEIVVNALSGGLTGSTSTTGQPASITATSGTPQSAAINTAFASPLVAAVKDASGNLMSGTTVTFTAPSTGQSGIFTGGATTITAITNAQGQAQVTITANATTGSYNVIASVAGVTTTAGFVLTNTAIATVIYKAPLIYTSSQRTIVTINNNGQSIGYLPPPSGSHYPVPVYWATPTAQPQTLTSSSDTSFSVNSINDSSQIVGGRFMNTGGGYKSINALYWSNPTAHPKNLTVPNNTIYTEARSINNSGQIAGWALTNNGFIFLFWTSPNDTPQVLQPPAGFSGSTIIIAPNSQIIANDAISGVFWASPSVPGVTLKSLNANDFTIPFSVNAAGVIVGMSNGPVTWANYTSPAQALPVPQGWNGGFASSINTAGVIVGASMNGNNNVGIIWENGQVQELNTLIPSGNSWTLGTTTLITDQGWILGTANNSADQTAQYILIPK